MSRALRIGLLALALLAPGLAARADAMFELCVREQFPDAVLGAGHVPQQFQAFRDEWRARGSQKGCD